VLSHTGPTGYSYNKDRFGSLTGAVEECGGRPYAQTVVEDVLNRSVMPNSVPGGDVLPQSGSALRLMQPVPVLNRYIGILQGMAVSYRVDGNRRAVRSEYRVPLLTATNGLVTSVHDFAQFDIDLDRGLFARRITLEEQAWRRQGTVTGLGWFVQTLPNGKVVVWSFGEATNAYSSLLIKVPNEHVTLVLLANSDGLSAPFPLANGDVTVSPFARLFFTFLG
jgi:hypothetical protein